MCEWDDVCDIDFSFLLSSFSLLFRNKHSPTWNVLNKLVYNVTAESDICTFATRTEHFHIVNKPSTELFTSNTRPKALRELYEAAAIVAVRSLDSLRRDGSSMDMFLCTPVLGKRRRDQSLDIESRIVSILAYSSICRSPSTCVRARFKMQKRFHLDTDRRIYDLSWRTIISLSSETFERNVRNAWFLRIKFCSFFLSLQRKFRQNFSNLNNTVFFFDRFQCCFN